MQDLGQPQRVSMMALDRIDQQILVYRVLDVGGLMHLSSYR